MVLIPYLLITAGILQAGHCNTPVFLLFRFLPAAGAAAAVVIIVIVIGNDREHPVVYLLLFIQFQIFPVCSRCSFFIVNPLSAVRLIAF